MKKRLWVKTSVKMSRNQVKVICSTLREILRISINGSEEALESIWENENYLSFNLYVDIYIQNEKKNN